MKDSIDFGSMEIPKLFRKLLIPTVLGMVFSAVFVITDGIFVGKGIGSDALAAVNITAPLFLISTGIGLMFGVGASVVASIHLSQGKQKSARINVTQAVVVSSLFLALLWGVVCMFAPQVARLLGSSERLLPLAVEYMHWFLPFLVFSALLSSGMFFVRLDGSPNYAMWCNAIPAVINIVLDYVFIFIFGWEMMGAALATSLGYVVGAAMIIIYLSRKKNVIHFCRVKLSRKSMQLTWRNVKYMCRLGASTFLCEGAIACMMFAGNYVFISYLGEDGVAAFSIACYFFPIIFMVYNAIGQSAQPILSYNFGAGDEARVRSAFRLALATAVICGLVFFALTAIFNHQIVAMFIDRSYPAYDIAVSGLPLFASGFVFFAVNIVSIGYFQSVERARPAMVVTVLRGFVFMVICLLGLSLQLLEKMEKFSFRKGDFLVQEGERNSNFYIISKGIWRGHYLNDGADVSVWFASEGEAVFSSWGYIENTPSLVSIEAMCDSELYGISKAKLESFYASSAELANFGRRLFEQQLLGLENWLISGGSPRAKERYLALLEENPELLQYVPLKHIASYLWITPQSLSRIRAGLGKQKKING